MIEPVVLGLLRNPPDPEAAGEVAALDADPVLGDPARGGGPEWMRRFLDYWNGRGFWARLPAPYRARVLKDGRQTFLKCGRSSTIAHRSRLGRTSPHRSS